MGGSFTGSARRFRRAMFLLLGVLFIGLGAGLILVQRMDGLSDSLRRLQSDNLTWRAAQLRTEHQQLVIALLEAAQSGTTVDGLPDPDAWDTVRESFDVYYARLTDFGFLSDRVMPYVDEVPGYAQGIEALRANRTAMAALIDDPAAPTPDTVAQLAALASNDGPYVRMLAMTALQSINELLMAEHAAGQSLSGLSRLSFAVLVAVFTLALGIAAHLGRRFAQTAVTLDAARARLGTIVGSSPEAIMACDRAGRVIAHNAAAARLTGYAQAAMPEGDRMAALIPLRHLRRFMPAAAIEAGDEIPALLAAMAGQTLRLPIWQSSGHILQIEVTAAIDDGPDGWIAIVFARDITDRLREQRRIRRARGDALQLAQTRERFLSEMSHELRTPLHGVIAALDLVEGQPMPADAVELLGVARRSARGALEQIDEVLETARLRHGEARRRRAGFVPAHCARTVVDELTVLAATRGNRILLECSTGSRRAGTCDPRAFHRALTNLVSNACKFTRDGEIVVRLLDRDDGMIRVEVEDSGTGIAPSHLPNIFRDYVTGDAEGWDGKGGAGLGLPIFAAAVRALDGHYGVHSVPGEGTLFWFEFPTAADAADAPALPAATAAAPDQTVAALDVLVVDDNPVNCDLLRHMLVRLGHRAEIALNGFDAVAMAAARRFDLVLTDIRMPGIDGYRTAALIREGGASRDATIMGVTAHLSQTAGEKTAAAAAQFAGILIKPLTTAELEAAIASLAVPGHAPQPVLAQPVVPAAPVLFDHDRVDMIREIRGEVWLRDTIATTLDEVAALTRAMEATAPHTSDEDRADRAHYLISSCVALGLMRLSVALRAVETALRGPGLSDPAAAAADLRAVADATAIACGDTLSLAAE